MWGSIIALVIAANAVSAAPTDDVPGCNGAWQLIAPEDSGNAAHSVLRCDWNETCRTMFSYDVMQAGLSNQLNIAAFDGPDCHLNTSLKEKIYFKSLSGEDSQSTRWRAAGSAHDIELPNQESSNFCVAVECANVGRPCSSTLVRVKMHCASSAPRARVLAENKGLKRSSVRVGRKNLRGTVGRADTQLPTDTKACGAQRCAGAQAHSSRAQRRDEISCVKYIYTRNMLHSHTLHRYSAVVGFIARG
jgi:hypothetical protein